LSTSAKLAFAALLAFLPVSGGAALAQPARGEGKIFAITSQAFPQGGAIPVQYTGEGKDVSPPLEWSGAPAEARSFALIVEDPDAPDPSAPRMVWTHWVLFNIPSSATGLAEGAKKLPGGAQQGLNDWRRKGYGGPQPPIGRHRYFFRLYALDSLLRLSGAPTKARLAQAMRGHILAEATLMGTYQSQKK
jgi:hypothetical protein